MLATSQVSLPVFPSFDGPEEPLVPISLTFLPPELPASPMEEQNLLLPQTKVQNDDELTSLNWLQKPGVLNSMCNALTGSPHRLSAMGCRSSRKPRASSGKSGDRKDGENGAKKGSGNSAEKMLNVVLSVRNKRYEDEDSHKPPLSFACMIFMALESSPTKTLPVKQIYEWIQWKFPYYMTASPGWKNSIRHNLSLNKCFKKVEKMSRKSRSVVTKGGLWTVDVAYRESILSALKMNPYHPYHKHFVPPYFPRSMIGALREELELVVSDKGLDPAERDAALSICLISGAENGGVDPFTIRAIYHDHNYTQLPTPPPSPTPPEQRNVPNLDEVLAAAEMILGGTEEVEQEETKPLKKTRRKRKSTRQQHSKKKKRTTRSSKKTKVEEEPEDEVYHSDFHRDSGEEEEEEAETDNDYSLADSGYSGTGSSPLSHESRSSSLDDINGANALLCLANNNHPTSSSGGGTRNGDEETMSTESIQKC